MNGFDFLCFMEATTSRQRDGERREPRALAHARTHTRSRPGPPVPSVAACTHLVGTALGLLLVPWDHLP